MMKRGRPALSPDEHSTPVQVKMPGSLYDRAYAAAAQEHISVPERIRQALERDLETQNRQS